MRIAIVGFLGILAALAAADPLEIEAGPLFEGPERSRWDLPLRVSLSNRGPAAIGKVVFPGSYDTDIPVELPTGSKKSLVVYPIDSESWGANRDFVQLFTDRGNRRAPISFTYSPPSDRPLVLAIGDGVGALAALRSSTLDKRGIGPTDLYVRPEDAPDRSRGYRPCAAVFIGPGAERLGDAQIDALREYALSGGTIVFSGGPNSAATRDGRWNALRPVVGSELLNWNASARLSQMGGTALRQPMSLDFGVPKADTRSVMDQGKPLITTGGYGAGRIVQLAFDPTDAPFDRWAGVGPVLNRAIDPGASIRAQAFFRLQSTYNGRSVVPSAATPGPPNPVPQEAWSLGRNPFNIKLPPTGQVFGYLAAYFVLVIPLNFLVLRKLRRGELAWVTAPCLSLAFAALLFQSAQGLYAAQLSRRTGGTIVLQSGDPNGVFIGTTEMFIPRADTYDLKLENARWVAPLQNGYGAPIQTSDPQVVVDNGSIKVPALRTRNLEFLGIEFEQKVTAPDWFSIVPLGGTKYRLTNRSPYDLTNAALVVGRAKQSLDRFGSGETRLIQMSADNYSNDPETLRDERSFVRGTDRSLLVGNLKLTTVGPQIGEDVSDPAMTRVLFYGLGAK